MRNQLFVKFDARKFDSDSDNYKALLVEFALIIAYYLYSLTAP